MGLAPKEKRGDMRICNPVAGSCKYGNKILNSVEREEFHNQKCSYQFLKANAIVLSLTFLFRTKYLFTHDIKFPWCSMVETTDVSGVTQPFDLNLLEDNTL